MITVDVKDLNKVYRLYQSPAQRLKEIILRKPLHANFAALNNINFSVLAGETFGIIGENGAGKSTLLKILAKTLKPTSGSVTITGRTAALLELGAGFNPELTGEENIYLNAYLLGLSKAEIDSKKQEIIAFSELGDFIKRPVKTYSSGMHVRLAFSIATSVNPDVLIIDEALSVGDQHFQKKCIDRMMQFKKNSKTILFCSHSLYHVQELCTKTLWLKGGTVNMLGNTERIITEYQNYVREKDAVRPASEQHQVESPIKIEKFVVSDETGNILNSIKTFEPVCLRIKIRNYGEPVQGHIGFAVMRNDGEICFASATHFNGYGSVTLSSEKEYAVVFPAFNLLKGLYYFRAAVLDNTSLHFYDVATTDRITVYDDKKDMGMFFMEHRWKL